MKAGGGDVIINQYGILFKNQQGELIFQDTAGGSTIALYSDASNWLVLANQYGGVGISFLLDNSSHAVKQIDFTGDGNIRLFDGYIIQKELSADPATPVSGDWGLYFKAGGLYHIDDAGNVTGPLGTGGAFLFPFATYLNLNPITASATYPYGGTVDRSMTLTQWSQSLYVATTNNGSNYWTITMKRITDGATVNSISTSAISANTWTLLTDTTFSISSLTTSDVGLYLECTKTGSPGSLYILCPALTATV
jgi:hypothetical protein